MQSSKPACYKIDWKAFKAVGFENEKPLSRRNIVMILVKYKNLHILSASHECMKIYKSWNNNNSCWLVFYLWTPLFSLPVLTSCFNEMSVPSHLCTKKLLHATSLFLGSVVDNGGKKRATYKYIDFMYYCKTHQVWMVGTRTLHVRPQSQETGGHSSEILPSLSSTQTWSVMTSVFIRNCQWNCHCWLNLMTEG